jgi:Flp pilus assembly protein TadG
MRRGFRSRSGHVAHFGRRFRKDEAGAVIVLVALALLPILAAVGGALDYARISSFRSRLEGAADATALMVARRIILEDTKPAVSEVDSFLKANLRASDSESLDVPTLDTSVRRIVKLTASGTIEMTFMTIFGFSSFVVSAASQVEWGPKEVEVAISLDTSNSMNSTDVYPSRFAFTKSATQGLLLGLRNLLLNNNSVGDVRVALIGWDTDVLIAKPAVRPAWLLLPADVSFQAWNSCLVKVNAKAVLYEGRVCRSGYYAGPYMKSVPMRSIYEIKAYQGLIDLLEFYSGGHNTNSGLGAGMAHATLLPSSPFGGGAAAIDDADVQKYVVLMTDGDNTETGADDQLKANCQNINDNNITIFTITMIGGNQSLLKECAGSKGKYYPLTNPAQIKEVFQDILIIISSLRLSK